MADVIQDVGVFNVKDELVFVDETLYLGGEEVTIESVELEIDFHDEFDLKPVLDDFVPRSEVEKDSFVTSCVKEETVVVNEIKEEDERNVDSFDHPITEQLVPSSEVAKESEFFVTSCVKEETVVVNEIKEEDQCSVDSFDQPITEQLGLSTDKLTCFKCSSSYNSPEELASHIDTHFVVIKIEEKSGGKRIWACKQCDKRFASRKGSVIHLRSHTGERPYSCSVCSKSFIDGSTLLKHQVIHRATRPFSCHICQRGFNQKVALQRHETTHTLQPLFTCRYCPKTFLVRSSLQAHENIHSRAKPFVCSFCPSRFHTPTLQKQHERVHTNERPYQCSFCPKAFKDGGTLFKHQVIHSQVKPYGCPLCSNGFTQKVAVQKHIKIHVQKIESKLCPVCKITAASLDDLCLHLEGHVLENPRWSIKSRSKYKGKVKVQKIPFDETSRIEYDLSDLTTLCDVAISTSENFLSIKTNKNSSTGQFYCLYCGMQFLKEKTLNSHLKGVHLFCVLCSTKFYDRQLIKEHECYVKEEILKKGCCLKNKVPSKENKPKKKDMKFSCEKCGKSFSSRNGFVIHQRSHTGERPYGCRWCEKAFGDSATRHKHERIHTNERPFKCLICSKAFNQRASLRAHEATHNRGLGCQHCPMSFPIMGSLRKHVEAKHSDVLEVSCPLCAKTCSDSSALHKHIAGTHVADGESRLCTLCDSGAFAMVAEYCDHLDWHAKQHVLDFYVNSKTRKQTKRKRINERKYSID